MTDEFGMHMHRRNTQAVEQKLIELDKMIRDQQIRLNMALDAMTSLFTRMNLLEAELGRLRIVAMGSGPTT